MSELLAMTIIFLTALSAPLHLALLFATAHSRKKALIVFLVVGVALSAMSSTTIGMILISSYMSEG